MKVLLKHALLLLVFVLAVWVEPLLLLVYLAFTLITSLLFYPSLSRSLDRRGRGKTGYLYAFYDVGSIIPAVKIGREAKRGSRLASHNTAAPLGLVVLFNFKVNNDVEAERYLHDRYGGQRLLKRKEWFVATPRLLLDCLLLRLFRNDS